MATSVLSRLSKKVWLVPVSNFYSKGSRKAHSSTLIKEAFSDYEDTEFEPLRIRGFALGSNFSRAHVDTIQYLEDEFGKVLDIMEAKVLIRKGEAVVTRRASFKSMFEEGFRTLELNIEGKKHPDPRTQFVTDALICGFLEDKDFHEDCLRCMHRIPQNKDKPIEDDESYICTLLANHLFSRLTIRFSGHHYFLTNDYHNKFEVCPCMKCGMQIRYLNTGIGSEYLWYGRPDIMVFTMAGGGCNIILPEDSNTDEVEVDIDDEAEKQIIEIKRKAFRKKEKIEQVVAQTITYSVYQRLHQLKEGKELPEALFIPTIVANSDFFDIYMYDTQNDILFRNKGDPIPIWDEHKISSGRETLKLSSILKIWMTLNHSTLKPKLSADEIHSLKGSCDFVCHLSPKRLNLIEKTMSMQKRFYTLTEMELELDVPSVPLKQKLLLNNDSDEEK